MTFLVIWLAGDVFNLVGVILQDLLPTMVNDAVNSERYECSLTLLSIVV